MKELNEEQKKQAHERFLADIENVDETDVRYASKKGQDKVNDMNANPPGALAKLWEDIKTMIALLGDYLSGDYKEIPWKVIAAIAGAIVYFVSPIDIIPDFIPVIGYLDDAMVIKLALDFAGDDLSLYRKWKNAK